MASRQISLFSEADPGIGLRDAAELIRLAGIDGLPQAIKRADDARYQEVVVKSALTEARGMPFRWALNSYRGCTHACQYCYARKYQRHLELNAGDDFSSVIFVKTNLPDVLRRELGRRSWMHETVAVGTATDPYQPIEGRYQITRRCLEILADSRTPFSIVTKGPMIVRDLDVLERASSAAGCQVFFSVPSVDDAACEQLEPGAAPPRQRLRAGQRLRQAGVSVGVLMMPLVPGITTSRSGLERTVTAIRDAGLRLAGATVARLDPGVREFFFEFIAREHPDLIDGYRRLYTGTHATAPYLAAVRAAVDEVREFTRPDGNS
ncbi:MAG: radical SAM protein [Acidobacteriota bacterium]